ncbi:hypothetical protein BEI02_15640 [Elizabethkingia sp. HvH-WGS333]|uniref:Uncharacterized protein n=2 Tax=Elizabethkingia anophelis TaxID=1117645 RepID=A0A455ZI20_9FLAO|nr:MULTISPECIES: hypothetical protein [Elizabethkingia]AIL45278.1 hypothetical protein BD94_1503 [Elizabethkingia anophelis NUHP1]MCL1641509.1 hypothetical protein [Elizabethkingia anophelis]MCL1646320.1 hypothetical protein [Elizabethkingia anophelis]MDV3473047.1 hypothetical protein [Elizabethkingia anophelis]OIK46318.1 hypothetical protein BEI02_15640 [Elizabethkingia sp. HvH-WGS333]
MEIAFLISSILLISYSLLALFDGVFLHLYKYRLYQHKESRFEHLTHTIRALLFTGILISLFINIENNNLFLFGCILIVTDIITLLVDAYVEKDSRAFMGGLPRWEYIVHLLVNGFHFAAIAVFLVIKINLDSDGIRLIENFQQIENYQTFKIIAINLLPGAIIISLLHILVYSPKFNYYFKKMKLKCC